MRASVTTGRVAIDPRREPRVLLARAVQIGSFVIFSLLAISMLYPYFYALGNSFKSDPEFLLRPYAPWPQTWVLSNYAQALNPSFGRMGVYVRNSAMYTMLGLIGQLCVSTCAAFAFARLRFPGRDTLFLLVLATMMLPYSVLLIPNFLIIHTLGLSNTVAGVVMPGFGSAFGIFMLRQFFLNQPAELEEAALIDGAGWFHVFRVISLPLAKPALVALGVFIVIGEWSSFIWPLVVLTNWELYPVTVGLELYRDYIQIQWTSIFAASMISALPLIVGFLFAQARIIGGIQLSGLKG
jgi:multiple sugar transport system permease protein